MIVRIHQKGTSFKGAAAYLLHDPERAASDERVEWTQTRNIATQNPETAWRVMAATAMSAEQLKAEAGVKATGRRSAASVLHFSLSWEPDERDQLDRDQMLAAAESAIQALAAGDRQALIVAHNDTDHPHVHVLVNRVSADDGRMLTLKNDRRQMQAWALKYEKERGQIRCLDREVNAEARKRGEPVRGERGKAPHVAKAEKLARPAANDDKRHAAKLREAEQRKDATLARARADMRARHQAQRTQLEAAHRERLAHLKDEAAADRARIKTDIQTRFRPEWRGLARRQESDRKIFEAREKTVYGKLHNAFAMLKIAQRIRGEHEKADRKDGLGAVFTYLTDGTARQRAFATSQAAQKRTLERKQLGEARQALKPLRDAQAIARGEAQARYLSEREQLRRRQAAEATADRKAWAKRKAEREKAWSDLAAEAAKREAIARQQRERANDPKPAAKRTRRPRKVDPAKTPDPKAAAPDRQATTPPAAAPKAAEAFKQAEQPASREDRIKALREIFDQARENRPAEQKRDRERGD